MGNKNLALLFEGLLQMRKNNYQQALDILDQMNSTNIKPPFKAYISATQAFLCWKLNQLGRALVELNIALVRVPSHAEWTMWRQQISNGEAPNTSPL